MTLTEMGPTQRMTTLLQYHCKLIQQQARALMPTLMVVVVVVVVVLLLLLLGRR